jgi:hypothetical protein
MKTNVSINLSDEQRRVIHENFYGGKKGLISRKDVNMICQTAITDWLMGRNNGPEEVEEVDTTPVVREIGDFTDEEIAEVMKQNELLQRRVNILQHKLDTRK